VTVYFSDSSRDRSSQGGQMVVHKTKGRKIGWSSRRWNSDWPHEDMRGERQKMTGSSTTNTNVKHLNPNTVSMYPVDGGWYVVIGTLLAIFLCKEVSILFNCWLRFSFCPVASHEPSTVRSIDALCTVRLYTIWVLLPKQSITGAHFASSASPYFAIIV
jgi:hypothetical protein